MSKPILTRWAAELQLRFLKALRAKIEALTDDQELVRDTLEGIDDADQAMEFLLAEQAEQRALAEARKALAKTYREAASHNDDQVTSIKAMILEALKVTGQDKWKGVAGTAFIAAGRWSTEILDPAAIPYDWQKAVPDVDKIGKELKELAAELEAMDDIGLMKAGSDMGLEYADNLMAKYVAEGLTGLQRETIINGCLALRIPGARIVKGEDSLTILPPRGKKENTDG